MSSEGWVKTAHGYRRRAGVFRLEVKPHCPPFRAEVVVGHGLVVEPSPAEAGDAACCFFLLSNAQEWAMAKALELAREVVTELEHQKGGPPSGSDPDGPAALATVDRNNGN